MEAAYEFFETHKQTFRGVVAGEYIDKEDFEIYAESMVEKYDHMKENLERIIDRIEENNLQNSFPSAYARAKNLLKTS